jgi:hypothetical protein
MSETIRNDIEHGCYRSAGDLIAELGRRLAEDDVNPNDTVSWEAIRTEAQARWKAQAI